MELDRAFESTLTVLGKVRREQLGAPTPCASWNVRALVNHFVGTARWWAATIAEVGEVGDVDYAVGDFVAEYQESIRIATKAFEADGALQKTVPLPFGEFPGAVLRGLAAMEQFTHGWDLARAIGHPTDLDPGLASDLLAQARLAITDSLRGADGDALFGPAKVAPAGAGPADQLAAFLGRAV
ncbi:TIGR03086 family protein [Kribbella pittospori]|uniref:TIGR03086 family protein n=1 Tax=Kribbella pittospori TaxID=722689 RepID=A0A4R0JYA3_9ACTN|nr:TIGR03086 family metal-binding protein [Kribbella pittospori]TCC52099.1 TIGR03086 family protein [Kribbella pittospori]